MQRPNNISQASKDVLDANRAARCTPFDGDQATSGTLEEKIMILEEDCCNDTLEFSEKEPRQPRSTPAMPRFPPPPPPCPHGLFQFSPRYEQGRKKKTTIGSLPNAPIDDENDNGNKSSRKCVFFNLNANQEDPSPWCLAKEEAEAIWYNKSEYAHIIEDVECTLKMTAAGLLLYSSDRGGLCLRGLESSTEPRRQRRRHHIRASHQAVFIAQTQKQNKDKELIIAEQYNIITKHFTKDAHQKGMWDAKNVSIVWSDKSPRMPRRMGARAG